MSRKNRNGQRQAKRPLNLKGIQMSMSIPTDTQAKTAPALPKPGFVQSASEVKMLDAKCSYQFTRLPSTILESDTSYQRPIDMKRVQRIVDNFDRRLVNPLKVSLRDGHYYVFDGAHTLSVLKEVNKFDNFMVDCMLMHGLTYEDEAYLFALQRGESKEVATAARLKALMIFNNKIDDNGVLIRSATDKPPYFAVGFMSEKANHKYRYVWLFKVRAKPVTENYSTKAGKTITRQTGEVEWTAIKRTHDGQYQAVADEGENGFTAEKAATFLQSVYAPTFTPAP